MRRSLYDPMTQSSYDYVTNTDKEEKLFQALTYVLDDKCPPDKEDYVCMSNESEEQDCKECWIRWATKDFAIRRNK